MSEDEFRRVVYQPYWCLGDPLVWEADGIGIAQFARNGDVGLFNLSWWLLNRTTPPPTQIAYRNTTIIWAIMKAPKVRLYGRPLIERCAMWTQQTFHDRLLTLGEREGRRFETENMKWETLRMLASRSCA